MFIFLVERLIEYLNHLYLVSNILFTDKIQAKYNNMNKIKLPRRQLSKVILVCLV